MSEGSGSGYACGVSGIVNDAPSGDLVISLDGTTLVGYAGSACGSGGSDFVDAIGSDGSLICAAPPAGFLGSACGSGWVTSYQSGSATCSTPTSSAVAPAVISSAITAANNWPITGFGSNVGTVYITSSGTLTGIDSTLAYDGMRVVFVNMSGSTVTLSNSNSSSLAANRFLCPDAITQQISNESQFELEYLTSATTTTPGWYVLSPSGGFLNVNTLAAGGAISSSSTITATSGLNVGGSSPASVTLQKGWTVGGTTAATITYFLDPASGLGCGYGSAGSATCHLDATGSADGSAWQRSLEIDDGKGSGSTHTIAFFDSGTYGEFLGSNNTTAEDLAHSGTFSGGCGSGSIGRNWASGGSVEWCHAGTWESGISGSGAGTATHIALWDSASEISNSANVTDSGSLFTISEALTQTGTALINTTGTASTTIGNGTGSTTLDDNVFAHMHLISTSHSVGLSSGSCATHTCTETTGEVTIGNPGGTSITVTFSNSYGFVAPCVVSYVGATPTPLALTSLGTGAFTVKIGTTSDTSGGFTYVCIGAGG